MQVQGLPFIILDNALMSLVVTGVGVLVMWPIRKARKEWISLKDAVVETKRELEQQRTNCLQTLQNQGSEQITLLTKVVDTLDGLRLDTQAQTGFIQGLVASPRRARAKK